MLVKEGRIIIVEGLSFTMVRGCEAPGIVTVTTRDGQRFKLPGTISDAHAFVSAYLRVLQARIEYREGDHEDGAESIEDVERLLEIGS